MRNEKMRNMLAMYVREPVYIEKGWCWSGPPWSGKAPERAAAGVAGGGSSDVRDTGTGRRGKRPTNQ